MNIKIIWKENYIFLNKWFLPNKDENKSNSHWLIDKVL